MSDCVLVKHSGCCCWCKYRLKLLGPFQRELGDFPQTGWVCIAFSSELHGDKREDTAYKGDFEHGMCELFMEDVMYLMIVRHDLGLNAWIVDEDSRHHLEKGSHDVFELRIATIRPLVRDVDGTEEAVPRGT